MPKNIIPVLNPTKTVQIKMTQEECDMLADIIWWFKGYNAALSVEQKPIDIYHSHLDLLRTIRIAFIETK